MKLGKHKSVDTILPVGYEQKKNLFVVSEEDLDYVYKKIKDKQLGENLVNSLDTNHMDLLETLKACSV